MTVTILGIESVSYVSKKSGQNVNGLKLYFAFPLAPDRGMGMKTDTAFISKNVEFTSQVGDKVELLYNRFGGVEEVRCVNEKK